MMRMTNGTARSQQLENTLRKIRGRQTTDLPNQRMIRWIKKEIDREHEAHRKSESRRVAISINRWKRNCRTSWAAVGNHLKKSTVVAPDITYQNNPLHTRGETCTAIRTHAESIVTAREEKMRTAGVTVEDQIRHVIQELGVVGPAPEIDWSNPTPDRIHSKMRESTGLGSPDGWHGREVQHFPLAVAETFAKLANRWREARYAPKATKIARQCNLIKESKIDPLTNTIYAGDLRPISVISVWWRIYTGVWVTSGAIAAWKQHHLPPEVIYDGQCTEGCAAQVMDSFKQKGFLGTLDYSLCYDHIDPKLVCQSMIGLGIPADIAELLQDVWTNIHRFVQFEGTCSTEAFDAGKMIMQGDSFGPFALHLLMAAGTRWVDRTANERIRHEPQPTQPSTQPLVPTVPQYHLDSDSEPETNPPAQHSEGEGPTQNSTGRQALHLGAARLEPGTPGEERKMPCMIQIFLQHNC